MTNQLKPIAMPDLIFDDHRNTSKSLENKLRDLQKSIEFESPTTFTPLKKLIIELSLLIVQERPKNDTANNKLISSFDALGFIEKSNFFVQSKMKEVSSIALEYLNQQKTNRDKPQEEFEIHSKEKNHNNHRVMALLGILHEITAKSQNEHDIKLKESYILRKMQPFGSDESKEDFQNRLKGSVVDARENAKNISDADLVKTNEILADIDDASKYLRDRATPCPNAAGVSRHRDEEDEMESYVSKNFSPSVR